MYFLLFINRKKLYYKPIGGGGDYFEDSVKVVTIMASPSPPAPPSLNSKVRNIMAAAKWEIYQVQGQP